MLGISDNKYCKALETIYEYLDSLPDAAYAWNAMKKRVDGFLEAVWRRNYATIGFQGEHEGEFENNKTIVINDIDYGLNVLSSHDANRLEGFKSLSSFNKMMYKHQRIVRLVEDSTLELISCCKEIDDFEKTLGPKKFELKACITTKVNVFFPLFRATPDIIATCGDEEIIIEVKETESTQGNYLQAMYQLHCQMVVWSIPNGMIAFKKKNAPRGEGWTFSRFTGNGSMMIRFLASHRNSGFCVKFDGTTSTYNNKWRRNWAIVPLITDGDTRLRYKIRDVPKITPSRGRKRLNSELASTIRERERAAAREEKRKKKEEERAKSPNVDGESTLGKRELSED